MVKTVLAIAALSLLAGCIPKSVGPRAADNAPPLFVPACEADKVQKFIGKLLNPDLAKQLQWEAGAALVRTAQNDAIITMDYNPDRLNVFHDDARIIARINCG
ncbi:MAG: hypothetical protein RL481_753 [Pseudomonadota bacterium]